MLAVSCSTTQNINQPEELVSTSDTTSTTTLIPANTVPAKIWSQRSVASFERAYALIKTNPKEAMNGFRNTIKIEPEMEAAYYNLLRLIYDETQLDNSTDNKSINLTINTLIETAANNNIHSARMLTLAATYQRTQGHFKNAELLNSKALLADPYHLASLANMAILQDLYLHNLDAALEYYEQYELQLTAQDKSDDRVNNWLADIKQRIKKQSEDH